jgi:hypothetical protein
MRHLVTLCRNMTTQQLKSYGQAVDDAVFRTYRTGSQGLRQTTYAISLS